MHLSVSFEVGSHRPFHGLHHHQHPTPTMRGGGAASGAVAEHHQTTSRALDDLCALLLTLLRGPTAPPRQTRASPAGTASLLLGASLALMLCGSVTFFIGFVMMPWVLLVLYFVGVLSSLSWLGRAILSPAAPPTKGITGDIIS